MQTKKDRQEQLLTKYGFVCDCEVCSANDSARHDANLVKLQQVYSHQSTDLKPEENVKHLEEMLEIARAEDREYDPLLIGEIYINLAENLLKIPDRAKRFTDYNLNSLAQLAFQNLTLIMPEDEVFDQYPLFLDKFFFMFRDQ